MMRMSSIRTLALLLFLLATFVHAVIDEKYDKYFRDRHGSHGSEITVSRGQQHRFSTTWY